MVRADQAGRRSGEREEDRMELRIVLPDSVSASALAARLSVAFGAERISLRRDRREVDVQVERGSDRAVLSVLDAVAGWFEQAAVGSAELRLGTHSYRLAR
jgi:hypothetical protein